MKTILFSIAFIGLAKQCTKIEPYAMLDKVEHPSYVHNMEMILADDLNADDTATAGWAKKFLVEFETNFKAYHPDKSIVEKLKKYKSDIAIKVVGGNWCSDTREQVPKMCKVLYYVGVPVVSFEYYRVDRNKKPLANDFASTRTIGAVPDIVVYFKGIEAGRIIEVPKKSMETDLLAIIKGL